MERLEEPEEQDVHLKTVFPRNVREVAHETSATLLPKQDLINNDRNRQGTIEGGNTTEPQLKTRI